MSFSLTKFKKSLSSVFKQIEADQSEAISIQVSANFIAGMTAAEKHKSTLPLTSADPEQEDPEAQEEGLTTEEKAEIALLVALYLGYLKGFNERAQAQILAEVEGMVTAGQTTEEIQKYVDDVFSGKEPIVIDNTGKKKKEIYVDKQMKLSEVEKVITKTYSTSTKNYAQLIGENASHASYEKGKEMFNRSQGLNQWVFSGPADERARPWHVALLGEVYEYGSEQSSYAERCLAEPRCRHRKEPYYGDKRDVPKEKWQQIKDEVGLYWDDNEERWAMKEFQNNPKTPKTTVEKKNTKAPKDTVKKEKKVVKEVQKVEVKRTPEEVEKIVRDNEKTLLGRTTEKGFLFDKNGKILLEKDGYEDGIHFTKTELKRFEGMVFTHNHPGAGNSFSIEDMKVACKHGLNEMRATTEKGTFIIKMADGSNFNETIYLDKIHDTFEKYRKQEVGQHLYRIQDTTRKVKITEEESLAVASKKIWIKTAKEIPELKYDFVSWD